MSDRAEVECGAICWPDRPQLAYARCQRMVVPGEGHGKKRHTYKGHGLRVTWPDPPPVPFTGKG